MPILTRLTGRSRTDLPAPRVALLGIGAADHPSLPRWVEHHAGLVGADALLMVLTRSDATTGTPASLRAVPGVHLLPVGVGVDEDARWRMGNRLATALLNAYDLVGQLAFDELLVADGDLADLLPRPAPEAVVLPVDGLGRRPVLRGVERDWTHHGGAVDARGVTVEGLRVLRLGG